ncbi:phage integrase family domain protein [Bacillus badius]|uniref:Phage integrase family domain protein n=1 Tax=Bacillus badius TaxID=1455 RepID=A0ABR5B0M3_BACBA|nr:phage integrase family domain protein [Bacillus badius]KIL80161.1 phage integrase family domain protein [Bacillus badius]
MLKFAIQDFLDDREFKNVSSTTMETYRILLKQFEEFCII